ncbi:uncharacterized protein LOC144151455 [Haemaphysalis longicornis]
MLQQTGDEDGIRHEAVKMATAPAAVMASNFGKLPELQPDSGNIHVYLERFELFVEKLQLFLTAIEENAYVTLRSLLLPKTRSKVTFVEATSVLKKHYAPKHSVFTERYRFNQRRQEAHESVTKFVVELKKLAATCEFGASLEDALRDRLIAGIQADAIRCRLLAMTDAELTWDRACSIATAMETATQDTKEVFTGNNAGRAPGDTEVHWQRQATTSRPAASKAPFNRPTPPKPGTPKKGKPKTFHPGSKPCHRCGGPHAPVTKKHPYGAMLGDSSQVQFFQILLKTMSAKRYLEIGTFTGYSAVAAALALPPDGQVVALDVDETLVNVGRPFWKEAGVVEKIQVRLGPAGDSLDALLREGQAGTFDFVFIDADKENYDDYYEKCLRLVKRNGLIAIDNNPTLPPRGKPPLPKGDIVCPKAAAYAEAHTLRLHPAQERLIEVTRQHRYGGMLGDSTQLQFFQILLKTMSAKRYLEIGTFTGCSAVAAALALPPDGQVVALDVDETAVNVGMPFWKEAGVEGKIQLRLGPAFDSLDALLREGQACTFDFVFIDADKHNCDGYYERSLLLVKPNGLIAIDNNPQLPPRGKLLLPKKDVVCPQAAAYAEAHTLRLHPAQERLIEVTKQHRLGAMLGDSTQLQFFQILLKTMSAKRYLEIGTYTGCSAVAAALALPPDGEVVALELREAPVNIGMPFWKEAGVEGKIHLRLGPAGDSLDAMLREGQAGTFDFAFIDADKQDCDEYYEKCLQLVKRNGIIAIDNVLWRGTVYDPKDNSPESVALRAFNKKLHQDERVDICLLPLADGVTFARKK